MGHNIMSSFPFHLKSSTLHLILELFISVLFNFQISEGLVLPDNLLLGVPCFSPWGGRIHSAGPPATAP